jgi:ATP-dependent Clp protease adaptor protein ClpS
MSTSITRPRTEAMPRVERPKVYKVILLNDDYTPREFVVGVLAAVFRMTGSQAEGVMLTAHQKGACVVAVFTREIAETKATEATDLGRRAGHPLTFTTEPEG